MDRPRLATAAPHKIPATTLRRSISFISLLLAQTNAFEPNSNAVSGAPSDCVLHKSLAAGCLKLGDRYDAVPVGVDLSEVYDVKRGVSLSQRVAAWHRLLPYRLALCAGQNSGRAAGRHGVWTVRSPLGEGVSGANE